MTNHAYFRNLHKLKSFWYLSQIIWIRWLALKPLVAVGPGLQALLYRASQHRTCILAVCIGSCQPELIFRYHRSLVNLITSYITHSRSIPELIVDCFSVAWRKLRQVLCSAKEIIFAAMLVYVYWGHLMAEISARDVYPVNAQWIHSDGRLSWCVWWIYWFHSDHDQPSNGWS